MIIYPEYLNKGDIIGITAPSNGANLKKIDLAEKHINEMGYELIETKSVREYFQLASTDAYTRFKEFVELWENKNVKMILAARGGDFLIEIIPYLHEYFRDKTKIKHAKWIQGYSDISTLNFYLTTNYNIATVQATNLNAYAMNPMHQSILNPFIAISNGEDFVQYNYDLWEKEGNEDENDYNFNTTEKACFKVLNSKEENIKFSGRLIGGCLDAILMYVNTKWDNVPNFIEQFKDEGIIWHIENYGLKSPDLYIKLFLMKQAGWFKYIKGILIGRSLIDADVPDFTYEDALIKGLADLDIPIIYDLDIGHLPPQWTMINGSFAEFEYTKDKCKLAQKKI